MWEELAKQIPGLTVLVVLTIAFLRHLKHRDAENKNERIVRDKAWAKQVREQNAEWRDALAEVTTQTDQALRKCATALDRNTQAMAEFAVVTRGCVARQQDDDGGG